MAPITRRAALPKFFIDSDNNSEESSSDEEVEDEENGVVESEEDDGEEVEEQEKEQNVEGINKKEKKPITISLKKVCKVSFFMIIFSKVCEFSSWVLF